MKKNSNLIERIRGIKKKMGSDIVVHLLVSNKKITISGVERLDNYEYVDGEEDFESKKRYPIPQEKIEPLVYLG